MLIGLISDTHGLLRPEALSALEGCERILHAGDIGSAALLEQLRAIAPVYAVRGNNDHGPWAMALPETLTTEVDGRRILVLHDLAQLAIDPVEQGIHAVVSGHSHRPVVRVAGDLLWINPGSAGPRRFSLPICLAILDTATWQARIVDLGRLPRPGGAV